MIPLSFKLIIYPLKAILRKYISPDKSSLGSHIILYEYVLFESEETTLKINQKLPPELKLLEFAKYKEIRIQKSASLVGIILISDGRLNSLIILYP